MAKNIIKLNRGDSYEFSITIPDKEASYHILADTEVIYFALLYPHQRFEDAIIIKGYDGTDQSNTGEILVKITPNDTNNLAPGIYYYTVKLHVGGTPGTIGDADEVRTIIERTKFIINE